MGNTGISFRHNGTTDILEFNGSIHAGINVDEAVSSNHIGIIYENSTTTDGTNGLLIENEGTGDATLRFRVTDGGALSWTMGIDNSADLLHLSSGTGVESTGFMMDTSDRFGMGGIPIASARLNLVSTSRGFSPPTMTAAQVYAISSPAEGLLAHNSTSGALMVFVGSAWKTITAT